MLDRRSLLVAGASSLASIMLPRVPGTSNAFILPFAPTEAYADEEDPFKVLVLSRTMFGVVVVDVANKMNPIAGAQVTLTSRYAAGKQLTATTDDEGTAIFEIAPLSEGYVDEATLLDAYDFNGGISISMSGYRDVEIPLARIQGGTAITAPTRPLSDGKPYFRQLTFDEWDIQYADATFMAMPKDDAANAQPDTHAFTVQAHLPQGGQATLHINKVMPASGSSPETVTQIGQVKASATGADNLATFTLEDKFLDAASGLLEEGCKLRFVLDYQGKTYTLSSPMGVATAPAAKAESGSTTIIPTTMDQEITPFDFPAAFPGIGGNKFTCWMPTFPILFDFSFAGYVLFGGGYKPASYMNDSGNPDPEYWKKSPRESGAKQANRYLDEMEGKWNQYKSMSAGSGTDPRNTKLLRHHCTLLFTMDIATQVYGSLAYDWVGKTWGNNNDPAYGNIKALFQVKTDLNWTEQFTLGPVPFFLNVNPWVLAKLALAVGAHTHGSGAAFFKNISLDYSNTSGSFTIQIGLAVTFRSRRCRRRFVRRARCRIPHVVHWIREGRRSPASAPARGRRRRCRRDTPVHHVQVDHQGLVGVVAHTSRFVEYVRQQRRPVCAPALRTSTGRRHALYAGCLLWRDRQCRGRWCAAVYRVGHHRHQCRAARMRRSCSHPRKRRAGRARLGANGHAH